MQIEKWFLDICENHIGAVVLKEVTPIFDGESVDVKQGINALRGLMYKLRMMGIKISRPPYIYGDNMSVVQNTSRLESVLRKNSNSVCFHTVHESVAMGASLVGHIPSKENVTDFMTIVFCRQKRKYLVDNIPYDIHTLFISSVRSDCNQASLILLVNVSILRGLQRCGNSLDPDLLLRVELS